MQLDQLIDGLSLRIASGDAGLDVVDVTDDSRRVVAGGLFIARPGAGADGAAYIGDAVARGAAAVLTEAGAATDLPGGVAHVVAEAGLPVDQALCGRLAERFFDHPSRKLRLVGVTGTNGKTTVAWLIRHLLGEAGVRAGLIGTIAIDDGSGAAPVPAELTTPGAIEFSRLLARMVEHGCAAAVAEVSSHALDQRRVDALAFDAAVFTNLSGDHLDYHKTMAAYADAKARLFTLLPPGGWAIINADDEYAVTMLKGGGASAKAAGDADAPSGGGGTGGAGGRVIWTTLDEKLIAEAEQRGDDAVAQSFAYGKINRLTGAGSEVRLSGAWGSVDLTLPLVGRHNVSNVLQATAAANALSPLHKTLRQSLLSCPQVPGRLERVRIDGGDGLPMVLVDYAHTDDALANVLGTLRPIAAGRLLVLVGCGGDRDRTKRPRMARVACEGADQVWITSDNPRTEDPAQIIDDMRAGVPGDAADRVAVIPDRAEAIAAIVAAAQPDDIVLLAGKGHEDYQIIAAPSEPGGTKKIHFDDREHAAAALRKRMAGGAG